MALTNYRKVTERKNTLRSEHHYEFTCQSCGEQWRTPSRVYSSGFVMNAVLRATHGVHVSIPGIGWLQKLTESGERKFAEGVEREAMQLGQARYLACSGCGRAVCANCQDGDQCSACAGGQGARTAAGADPSPGRSGPRCPACNTASDGGRFCPECGFDLAAAYKSCPACAAQLPRAANYCPDCGHSF